MSKGKEKVIEVEDDELDFLPGLLAEPAFDPRILLEPIRSANVGTNARSMSPEVTTSPNNNDDEGSFGSKDALSEDIGEDSGEVSSPGAARPEKNRKLGGRALTEHYTIGLMTCRTTIDDLVSFEPFMTSLMIYPLEFQEKKHSQSTSQGLHYSISRKL